MNTDETIDIARKLFARADELVKQRTGAGIVGTAFDLAAPAITKQMPALAILLPLIRRLILPLIENALSAEDYTQTVIAVQVLEESLEEFLGKVGSEHARIMAMSDDEVNAYIATNELERKEE